MVLKTFYIKEFPTEIGDFIEFPNIAELLFMPMYGLISYDDLYKTGPDFYRTLLSKCPITGNYKYVAISSYMQLLSPNAYSVSNKINTGYKHEWHTDAIENMFDEPSTIHIIMSDCTATTSFNEHAMRVNIDKNMNNREFIHLVNEKADEWELKPKKVEPQKFCTFTNHVHRSTAPDHKEFRFFFRVMESNYIPPRPDDIQPATASYIGALTSDNTIKRVLNILHNDNSILISRGGLE
jgi:hypothetical protein